MTRYSVRLAKDEDRHIWLDMRRALWPDTDAKDLADDLVYLLDNDSAWLAFEGEKPVGFIEASIRNVEGQDLPWVEGVWIAESHRKTGAARELLQVVEQWAKKKGHDVLLSDAEFHNNVSHKWHSASGFEEIERIIIYQKDI